MPKGRQNLKIRTYDGVSGIVVIYHGARLRRATLVGYTNIAEEIFGVLHVTLLLRGTEPSALVGLIFLPLRNLLAWGDPLREGRVFYVFAAALAGFGVALNVVYREQRERRR